MKNLLTATQVINRYNQIRFPKSVTIESAVASLLEEEIAISGEVMQGRQLEVTNQENSSFFSFFPFLSFFFDGVLRVAVETEGNQRNTQLTEPNSPSTRTLPKGNR